MWVAVDDELAGHVKLGRVCRRLGVGENEAIGLLTRLWLFTGRHAAADGVLEGFDADDVAYACGWHGDASGFVDALCVAGFLSVAEGLLSVHDWLEHQGPLAARERERLRGVRRREEDRLAEAEDSYVPASADGPRMVRGESAATVTSTVTVTGTSTEPPPSEDVAAAAASEHVGEDIARSLVELRAAWRDAYGRAPTRAESRLLESELRKGKTLESLLFAVGELSPSIERPLPYVKSVLRRVRGPSPGEQLEMPVLARSWVPQDLYDAVRERMARDGCSRSEAADRVREERMAVAS